MAKAMKAMRAMKAMKAVKAMQPMRAGSRYALKGGFIWAKRGWIAPGYIKLKLDISALTALLLKIKLKPKKMAAMKKAMKA
jgi:hypothetical protein